MPRSQWDKLRDGVFTKAQNRCEICGGDGELHCHEVWTYDKTKRVQKLSGFRAVCSMCHHVIHFGKTQILADKGYLDLETVIRHFERVNKVTSEVFEEHRCEAFMTWELRSRRKWLTDLGKWSSLIPKKAGT